MEDKITKFKRIFANIPEKIRKENIIVVIDNKPYTWDTAMIEIESNSNLGKKIIKQFEKIKNIVIKENKKTYDKEIKELILWNLETSMPKHLKLSLGIKGTFSKEELKKHIQQEDEIGLAFVKIQFNFIKALINGEFSKVLTEE